MKATAQAKEKGGQTAKDEVEKDQNRGPIPRTATGGGESGTSNSRSTIWKKQLEASQRAAREDEYVVVSPIDGTVTAIAAHTGEFILSGAPLATILSRACQVEAKVSEENRAGVPEGAEGHRATAHLSRTRQSFRSHRQGVVLPAAEQGTQRYGVVLDVKIDPGLLVPGLTGQGEHRRSANTPIALIIPQGRKAMVDGSVLVVENGRIALRKVTPGFQSLNEVEITEGLKAGDLVVVEEMNRFQPGRPGAALDGALRAQGSMAATSANFAIALRFLTARKRAMLMSLACIAFGTGLFVITRATTGGFEELFIHTVLGTDGAIRIEDRIQDMEGILPAEGNGAGPNSFKISNLKGRKFVHGIEEPEELMAAVRRFENVSGVSAVLEGFASAQSDFNSTTARIYGIELDDHLKVSDLATQIQAGSLQDFRATPNGVLVGREMADWLKLSLGDSLTLQANGESRPYRVSAIYDTGVSEIDKERIYVHLPEARSLLHQPVGATFLQVGVRDRDRAEEDRPTS